MSFWHKSTEYMVGDFVETKSGSIFRIERLYYEKDCDAHPRLSISGIKYIPASAYNAAHEPPVHDYDDDEIVCLNEKRSFYAPFISRKLSVVSREQEALPHDYVCRYSYEQNQLHLHEINNTPLCDPFVLQGIYVFFIILGFYLPSISSFHIILQNTTKYHIILHYITLFCTLLHNVENSNASLYTSNRFCLIMYV